LLHNGDETAERLGVESGDDGDPTSIGRDEFEVGLGGGDRPARIGKDGDREEVSFGTGERTIVAGGGIGREGLVEMLSEGVKRDLATAAELGASPKRQAGRCPGGPGRRSSCTCRRVAWRGQRGPRCSVQTWTFLQDSDETAESLRVESGGDGDPTSIGQDEFEVGLGGRNRQDRIRNDGDREKVVVGTGGRTIVARGELGREGLVEMLAEGMKRDLATAAELGLSQTAPAEIIEEGIPA
jgi:hypothetical protein